MNIHENARTTPASRYLLVQRVEQGWKPARVAEAAGITRKTASKWLRRFREAGWAGLQTRTRAPKRRPRSTPASVVAKVLAVRTELQAHRTRASRFAGIGAETIRLELARRRVRPLPGLRTIERIVKEHGLSGVQPSRRKSGGEPYPAPRACYPGDLQQTDLVGPRHLRGPKGITRFYSFHTVALVGRGAATSQARHKSAEALCAHFVHAWSWLGLPRISQMDNEMAASGGGRHPYAFSLVMRLHLLLGIHLLFIPEGEPGRNAHIESFNEPSCAITISPTPRRALQLDAQLTRLLQRDLGDDRLDVDLAATHIELLDDFLQRFEVARRGVQGRCRVGSEEGEVARDEGVAP
jgi:transposase